MWVIRSWFEQIAGKKNDLLEKSVHLSPFYAQEKIAPVALYKRATVSDLLRSLMTKEQWEQFALFYEQITLSLKKTSESLEKPMIEIPTLTSDHMIPNHLDISIHITPW